MEIVHGGWKDEEEWETLSESELPHDLGCTYKE